MQCTRCNVPMIWLHGYDLRRCNYEDEANVTEFYRFNYCNRTWTYYKENRDR